jgi:integrase
MRKGKGHYGSGSIDRSGENSWRIRYRLNGVRYTKVVEGSKTEAAKELRRLLHTGDSGQHVAPDRITLGQWVTDWLALKKRSIKPLTYERYEGILTQHVVPVLGAIPLQKITAPDVDKLYTGLAFGPSTAQLLHIVLKSCFASAAKKKLRADNPVADAEKPSGEARTDEIILDEDELGRLVQGFRGHSIYLIVAVAAFTGMRRNEILALRWVDVDLNAGMITVCRNVEQTKAHGRRTGTPKSKAGHRTFQIDPGLVDRLRKERDLALRIVAGIPDWRRSRPLLGAATWGGSGLPRARRRSHCHTRPRRKCRMHSSRTPDGSASRISASTISAPLMRLLCSIKACPSMSSPSDADTIRRCFCGSTPGVPKRPTPTPRTLSER